MNWGSWENFVAMGGYGFYVWGSYGATVILIVAELALLRLRRRAAETTLAHTLRARQQREQA